MINPEELKEDEKIRLLEDLIFSNALREMVDNLYSDFDLVKQTISIYHLILLAKENLKDLTKNKKQL